MRAPHCIPTKPRISTQRSSGLTKPSRKLKAVVIETQRQLPPRTHNLLDLAKKAGLPPRFHGFIRELSPQYLVSRYPDAAGAAPADLYDGRVSRIILRKSEEVRKWARRKL